MNAHQRIILFISLATFLCVNAFAQTPIDLSLIKNDHWIQPTEVKIYCDSSGKTADSLILSGKRNDRFKTDTVQLGKVEDEQYIYWIRFRCYNKPVQQKFVLEVISQHTEQLALFIPDSSGDYVKKQTGQLYSYYDREYKHKNFIFDFVENVDTTKFFYLKIKSRTKVAFIFRIRTQQEFTQYSLNEYILLGLYYGLLVMLLLYNLLLFLSTKERVYLFYVLTVLCSIASSLSDDGLGYSYIWTDFPHWNLPLGVRVLPLAFLICYTAYAYTFFSNREDLRKLKTSIAGITLLYLVYYFITVLISDSFVYFNKLYSIPFIVIYIIYLYSYFKGDRTARFFIIGNTFALAGIVINQLRLLEIVPGNLFTVYSFNIGIVLEGMAFSLAISDRFSILRKEQEDAREKEFTYMKEISELQEKVNKELEGKVKERTHELEVNNKKLESLVTQLQTMSIELDKDNWKLKRSIKEEKEARILAKEISYDEFMALYPTQAYCLEYLAELKWGKGFKCKKCSYEKSSVNPENKSRKCSRCGTTESATAGTIYHSVKIGLPVAFYMTYKIITDEKNTTGEKLAETTGLSHTSCINFKRRILDQKEAIMKKLKLSKIENWTTLILNPEEAN